MVKFFNKCESQGIKPISGSSLRVIFDEDEVSHELLFLAKNNNGHKNITTGRIGATWGRRAICAFGLALFNSRELNNPKARIVQIQSG